LSLAVDCERGKSGTVPDWADKDATMLGTVLVILLILLLIGAFPRWGYSSGWGYGPSGLVGIVLVIVLVLALTGRV
jgi:hypothetical protein